MHAKIQTMRDFFYSKKGAEISTYPLAPPKEMFLFFTEKMGIFGKASF